MKPRKEIIQLDGRTLTLLLVVVANIVVAGIMYRWSQYQSYELTKYYAREYSREIFELRDIKNDVVKLEGASSWNETIYASIRPESRD